MTTGASDSVAERLKDLRIKLNLNQKEVAERIGVSRAYWSALEKGNRQLTGNIIRSIVQQFEVSADWLITGKSYRLELPQNYAKRSSVSRNEFIQQEEFIVFPLISEINSLKRMQSALEGKEFDERDLSNALRTYHHYQEYLLRILAGIESGNIDDSEVKEFQSFVEQMIENYQQLRRDLFKEFSVEFLNSYYRDKKNASR